MSDDALLSAVEAHCRSQLHARQCGPPAAASPEFDLDLDVEKLDAAAAALAAQEAVLDAKLAALRKESAAAAAAEMPALRARGIRLAETRDSLDTLATELAEVSREAYASSAALRAAHQSRERVAQAREIVDELLTLEECADDVEAALSRGDFAAAVARVAPLARALAVEEPPEAPAAAAEASQPALARDATREGERAAELVGSLRQRISEELQRVAGGGSDVGSVCNLAKLMGPLGRAEQGAPTHAMTTRVPIPSTLLSYHHAFSFHFRPACSPWPPQDGRHSFTLPFASWMPLQRWRCPRRRSRGHPMRPPQRLDGCCSAALRCSNRPMLH